HPRWREGRLSTGFIAEEYPDGFHPVVPDAGERQVLAAVAASVELVRCERLGRLSGRLRPGSSPDCREWVVRLGEDYLTATVTRDEAHAAIVIDSGEALAVASDWLPGDPVWRGQVGGNTIAAQIRPRINGINIAWRGMSVDAFVMEPHVARLERLMPKKAAADTSKFLLCPMPGLVVSIGVAVGQEVKAGETLAVVEAMKMENVLRAERDLTVGKIVAAPGDSLAVDAVIMEFA
ncbi:MAG TPA: biotin/lipoyl-containing protein, partial [Rhizobiaceae bacterium]